MNEPLASRQWPDRSRGAVDTEQSGSGASVACNGEAEAPQGISFGDRGALRYVPLEKQSSLVAELSEFPGPAALRASAAAAEEEKKPAVQRTCHTIHRKGLIRLITDAVDDAGGWVHNQLWTLLGTEMQMTADETHANNGPIDSEPVMSAEQPADQTYTYHETHVQTQSETNIANEHHNRPSEQQLKNSYSVASDPRNSLPPHQAAREWHYSAPPLPPPLPSRSKLFTGALPPAASACADGQARANTCANEQEHPFYVST